MNHRIGRVLTASLVLAVLTVGFAPVQSAPPAASQTTHVVRWGESLESMLQVLREERDRAFTDQDPEA